MCSQRQKILGSLKCIFPSKTLNFCIQLWSSSQGVSATACTLFITPINIEGLIYNFSALVTGNLLEIWQVGLTKIHPGYVVSILKAFFNKTKLNCRIPLKLKFLGQFTWAVLAAEFALVRFFFIGFNSIFFWYCSLLIHVRNCKRYECSGDIRY